MTATPSPEELERVLKRLARDLDSKAAVAARTEGLERAEAPIASDAEALRAAAALIRELVGREKWQPIETAPKDGTRLMLWMQPVNDARFQPTDGPHAVFGTWVVWSAAMQREGMKDGWSWYGSAMHCPTHWRPLPAPPVEAK